MILKDAHFDEIGRFSSFFLFFHPSCFRDDPRLQRLATAAAESKEDAAAMRREIRRAEIIKAQIDELKAEAENREKQETDEGDGKAREVQVK